jgi:hypothetical protein
MRAQRKWRTIQVTFTFGAIFAHSIFAYNLNEKVYLARNSDVHNCCSAEKTFAQTARKFVRRDVIHVIKVSAAVFVRFHVYYLNQQDFYNRTHRLGSQVKNKTSVAF